MVHFHWRFKIWHVLAFLLFEYQSWTGTPLNLGVFGFVLSLYAITILWCSCLLRQQLSFHGGSYFKYPVSAKCGHACYWRGTLHPWMVTSIFHHISCSGYMCHIAVVQAFHKIGKGSVYVPEYFSSNSNRIKDCRLSRAQEPISVKNPINRANIYYCVVKKSSMTVSMI